MVRGALREPHALLAFRANFVSRGAERRLAMVTATDESVPAGYAGVDAASMASAEIVPRLALTGVPDRRTYVCSQCGHTMRVFGCGRHRVYFETGDERFDDPVMDGACPECGHALPGRNGAS
jgi:hypothetical protein